MCLEIKLLTKSYLGLHHRTAVFYRAAFFKSVLLLFTIYTCLRFKNRNIFLWNHSFLMRLWRSIDRLFSPQSKYILNELERVIPVGNFTSSQDMRREASHGKLANSGSRALLVLSFFATVLLTKPRTCLTTYFTQNEWELVSSTLHSIHRQMFRLLFSSNEVLF